MIFIKFITTEIQKAIDKPLPDYSRLRELKAEIGYRHLPIDKNHEKFNEPAAVSRYVSCLEQDGVFDRICGLIFGHYSENPNPLLEEILLRVGEKHQIPVVMTDDFGHGKYNQILPIGARAILDADRGNFYLCESGVE